MFVAQRPSTIPHIYPSVLQAVGPARSHTTLSCGFWTRRTVAMQDLVCELRRTPIPRNRVNRSKREGQLRPGRA